MQHQFLELHNNHLLYLFWHSKFLVEKCIPSLFLQSVVGQSTPKVVRLGKHVHSKQRKSTLTQPLQFHVKFMSMPCYC